MNKRSIYLYTSIAAFIAGVISLVFMLKDKREKIAVTDYIRHAAPTPEDTTPSGPVDSSKSTTAHSPTKGTSTVGNGKTHNLASPELSYATPTKGDHEGVKIYKIKGELTLPTEPKVGDVVLIPIPQHKEGAEPTTATYTCILDKVTSSDAEAALITLHGRLTEKTPNEGGKFPNGDVIITIVNNHSAVDLQDKANERLYYIFYTKTADGKIEYSVEETDTAIFPLRPKADSR